MIEKLLYTEVNFIGLFIVALMCKKGKYSVKHQLSQRLFEDLLYIMGLMLILDTLGWVTNGETYAYAYTINLLSSAAYMCFAAVLGFSWLRYCDCILLGGQSTPLKTVIFFIPAACNVVISLLSISGNGVFYIDSSNIYHRGALFSIHLALLLMYLISSTSIIFYKFVHTPKAERGSMYSFILFLTPPAIGVVVQGLFYGISIVLILCVMSALMIFINFQNDLITVDQITGICNRLAFEKFTRRNTMMIKKNQVFFMIMIDVDNFKKINDRYGHLTGDAMLRVIADVLREVCNSVDMPARIGGDEFAVVGYRKNSEQVERLVRNINEQVMKRRIDKKSSETLSVSTGSAVLGENGISSFDELVYNADQNMYRNKKEKKAKIREQAQNMKI